MTSTSTKIFDEVAKLLSGAAGMAQGLRDEIDALIKNQLDRLIGEMDLVKREEFEVVKEMASRARMEVEELKQRMEALEAEVKTLKGGKLPMKATSAPTRKTGKGGADKGRRKA